MQRPDWLRLEWPPSRPVAATLVGVVVLAIAGGALIGLGVGRPGLSSRSSGPTPSPSGTVEASATPRPTRSPTQQPTQSPIPLLACPLNGLPIVEDPALLDLPPLAVQIENHPQARPARNLGNADMVVEATVEGDVTRYTGIFLCRPIEGLTGPVRSARYYSIDLWQDMRVLPVFFGSATEAVGRYHAAGMPFVNGITGQWPWFHRSGTAPAPHNLYADLAGLRGAVATDARLKGLAGRVGELRAPFAFAEGAQPTGRPIGHLEIWTNGFWHFGWEWNAETGRWERSEAGVAHVDVASGEVLSARSVVVQLVREDVVDISHDPGGNPRRYHHLVGSGRGVLYVDGRAVELDWSRPTAQDATRWTYTETGEPVVLPPGVVWWEIVPLWARLVETAG
jgi:hypothetical protein